MRLVIEHTTTFSYDQPISEAYTEMRLRPSDTGGQRCLAFSLLTEPRGEVLQYADRFGNDVRHFDVLEPHRQLVVAARSEVATPDQLADPPAQIGVLDNYDYQMPTPFAPHSPAVVDFASAHRQPDDPWATATALMDAIAARLIYERGVTHVHTTADEVLGLRRGVCQDYAHLMLAACRSQGLAARYVSGYLYAPTNGASAASHAWVDVLIPGQGWRSLDPTHNRPQTEAYVRVAVGRDYADVPPTRGVYKGNARETLSVEVNVTAV